MREILFRGKDIAGNWHYGVPLVFTDDYVCITAPHTYNKAVIPETVGQYTGLTDKNGKKIFEGDVVKRCNDNCVVKWVEEDAEFGIFGGMTKLSFSLIFAEKLEVIGNIHDKPEPPKEGADNG